MFFILFLFAFYQGSDCWNYDDSTNKGPSSWDSLTDDHECDGDRQSPIDIPFLTSTDIQELDYSEKCNRENYLDFDLSHSTFRIYNNGHGFSMAAVNGSHGNDIRSNTSTIARLKNTYDGEDTMYHSEYCLDSLHFHFGPNISYGSEHTFNGIQYPIEGHFVFYSCNYAEIRDAIVAYQTGDADVDTSTESDTNVLAVVGILFEVDNQGLDNAAFTQISSSIGNILYEDDNRYITTDISGFFGGADVLDSFMDSVYIYEGSLTTPPCLESVLWHVSTEVLSISRTQLESLYSLVYWNQTTTIGDFGNYRPVQDLNDRTIYEQECKSTGFILKISFSFFVLFGLFFLVL